MRLILKKATPDGIKLKRGKGSQKDQNVAVMAESSYLDEFCHKLNRRYFGKRLFDRMVIAAANNYW